MTSKPERFYKYLAMAEMLDTLLPPILDNFIARTAITAKTNADDINLNRSKTTQQARKIEDKLAADLETWYRKILKDPLRAKTKDSALLQRKYGGRIEQLVRSAVQQIYLIGADYATKTQNTTAFITTRDLDNIRNQVRSTTDRFWRRIYAAVHRNDVVIPTLHHSDVIIPTIEEKDELEPLDETSLISTVTATMTLALATLSKLGQIFDTSASEDVGGVEIFGGTGAKRKLVWVTEQDAQVCNICAPLNGQQWYEDDAMMPLPGPESEGGNTHHRCRCRLMVKNGDGEIFVG